jgi:hypothetical protein
VRRRSGRGFWKCHSTLRVVFISESPLRYAGAVRPFCSDSKSKTFIEDGNEGYIKDRGV